MRNTSPPRRIDLMRDPLPMPGVDDATREAIAKAAALRLETMLSPASQAAAAAAFKDHVAAAEAKWKASGIDAEQIAALLATATDDRLRPDLEQQRDHLDALACWCGQGRPIRPTPTKESRRIERRRKLLAKLAADLSNSATNAPEPIGMAGLFARIGEEARVASVLMGEPPRRAAPHATWMRRAWLLLPHVVALCRGADIVPRFGKDSVFIAAMTKLLHKAGFAEATADAVRKWAADPGVRKIIGAI